MRARWSAWVSGGCRMLRGHSRRARTTLTSALELIADDRELGQGGVQHSLLQGGVAAEQEAERGDQDEQQGKQGEEAVPGQQGGEVAALVVAELLHHREQEPEPTVPLLVAVDAAERSFNRVHHCPPPGRMLAGRITR